MSALQLFSILEVWALDLGRMFPRGAEVPLLSLPSSLPPPPLPLPLPLGAWLSQLRTALAPLATAARWEWLIANYPLRFPKPFQPPFFPGYFPISSKRIHGLC